MGDASRPLRNLQIYKLQPLLGHYFLTVAEAVVSYRLPAGEWSPRRAHIRVDRGSSVAALLFDRSTQRLVFVRQFRFPAYDFDDETKVENGWLIELAAGRVERNEQPDDAVVREIGEETGLTVHRVELISRFFLSPGASTEQLHLYYAEVDPAAAAPSDGARASSDEDYIERVTMTVDEFLQRIAQGKISDAKTICAAEWLRRNLARLAAS